MTGTVNNGRIDVVRVAGGLVYEGPAAIQDARGDSAHPGASIAICWRPLATRRGVAVGDEVLANGGRYRVLSVQRSRAIAGAVVIWCGAQ